MYKSFKFSRYKGARLYFTFSLFFGFTALVGCQLQKRQPKKNSLEMAHPVSIYGFLHPKPEKHVALKNELLSLARSSRQESGNMVYNIHQEKDGSIFLYEVWKSQSEFDKHLRRAEVQQFMAKVKDYLTSDIEAHSGELLGDE